MLFRSSRCKVFPRAEHERMESWIVSEVERGAKLPGLYPMNEAAKARYAAWKKK